MQEFLNNLFLTLESWVIVYVVLALFWYVLASSRNEKVKYVAWTLLLVTTIVFVAGIFFEEVRNFFYLLTR